MKSLSLKWRTIISVFAIISLVMGISAVWTIYHIQQREKAELIHQGQLLTDIQARALSEALWDKNLPGIDIILKSLNRHPDFQQARVFNLENHIISQHGDFEASSTSLNFSSPVIYRNGNVEQAYGTFELTLSQKSLEKDRHTNLLIELIVAAILLVSTLLVVYWTLNTIVIKPIRQITQVMKKMSEGNLNQVIPFKRYDELGEMVATFNQMAKTLATQYQILEERNQHLKIARDQATQASKAKSAFLANMSHELRTPLTAILGYSELLLEAINDKTTVEDIEKIQSSANHLLSLINELLDLSKIEAGKAELVIQEFAIPKLINDVKPLVKPLLDKNHNVLQIHIDKSITTMESDQMKIRQCLVNLLSNAAKFTKSGLVQLSVDLEKDDWIIISVKDSGIGMTNEQMDKIFEAFTQADDSTSRLYGGTGLGLALTRETCTLLGGDITVASQAGQGSTFSMRLPRKAKKSAVLL